MTEPLRSLRDAVASLVLNARSLFDLPSSSGVSSAHSRRARSFLCNAPGYARLALRSTGSLHEAVAQAAAALFSAAC